MLLSDAVAVYIADRHTRGEVTALTARHLRSRLGMLVAACPSGVELAQLDRGMVRVWQGSVGGLRPASRRSYLSTVRTFCTWCAESELMTADPTAGLGRIREPRHMPRALSAGQMARLRLVLPDARAELVVGLMAGCGLRCCEVARLQMADYDAGSRTVFVVGKRGDERVLPVPGSVADLVDRWAAGRRPGRLVGLSASSLSRMVSGWMDEAGIKTGPRDGISAHALRHTFASDMLDRCGNVRVVQEALGHVSLATTQRYLRRASLEQLRAAMGA
jgi:site-specific recombinase XerC